MAGVLQGEPGGIQGLIDLPGDHWEAIQADLVDRGLTVDDIPHRLDWAAVLAMVKHCREGSALFQLRRREKVGAQADWPIDRHLKVLQIDELRVANWQRVAASYARAKRTPPPAPKPMWRPGTDVESVVSDGFTRQGDKTLVGSGPIPMADFDRWWSASQDERDGWEAA